MWLKFVSGSREEAKYVQKLTNDDVQKQIAIGHLSDSGDLKLK